MNTDSAENEHGHGNLQRQKVYLIGIIGVARFSIMGYGEVGEGKEIRLYALREHL